MYNIYVAYMPHKLGTAKKYNFYFSKTCTDMHNDKILNRLSHFNTQKRAKTLHAIKNKVQQQYSYPCSYN